MLDSWKSYFSRRPIDFSIANLFQRSRSSILLRETYTKNISNENSDLQLGKSGPFSAFRSLFFNLTLFFPRLSAFPSTFPSLSISFLLATLYNTHPLSEPSRMTKNLQQHLIRINFNIHKQLCTLHSIISYYRCTWYMYTITTGNNFT